MQGDHELGPEQFKAAAEEAKRLLANPEFQKTMADLRGQVDMHLTEMEVAQIATAEMWQGMVKAGIPEAWASAIMGAYLAYTGRTAPGES